MPLLDRPYLEHIGTLSHKSAGGIDRGFLVLKYLHNAIATSVAMERYHGDLTSSSPPRACAARASLKARVASSRFNRGSEVVFADSMHRRDSSRRSSRSSTRVPSLLLSAGGVYLSASGAPKVAHRYR